MNYETQENVERMYNKNQTFPLLEREFSSDAFIRGLIKNSELPEEFCLSLLCQMALHKRTDIPTLVGCLFRFGEPQEIADMIYKAACKDLVDYNPGYQQIVIKWVPSPDIYALIE